MRIGANYRLEKGLKFILKKQPQAKKKGPLVVLGVIVRDYMTQLLYIGIMIYCYEDSYSTTSIMESRMFFFRGSPALVMFVQGKGH